ncbi:hypothetical protein C0Q70_03887 [Pomacea canaliculata]|uniref:Endoglucanase n=1 Tax=Pomacea canaliculata TaxID=400727 RepID=A0A2T7PTZ3_POMCA|nr:hypothetical protein C0Q70_03887 [Pomacea canaliculata]
MMAPMLVFVLTVVLLRIEPIRGLESGASDTRRRAPEASSTPAGPPPKRYNEALRLSNLFYYAQRSGKLPANNPVPWRKDSALLDCVVGGFYDAGDHVKFGFPFGAAMTMLLWGVVRFRDGYVYAGQLDDVYTISKWGLDYMVNSWDPFREELVIQVGDGDIDHQFWGRPEDMTMPRPCLKIGVNRDGSDVAADYAAALAAGSIVFREKGDVQYARELLLTAESIYDFAVNNRGLYSNTLSAAQQQYYRSTNDKDEMCVAGVWLFKATGDDKYLYQAELAAVRGHREAHVRGGYRSFLKGWQPGGFVQYTPCGLAWSEQTYWGSNRHAANVAFAALVAAEDGIAPEVNRKWAAEQINYILGDNPHDGGCFSYEIGYGNKYPLRPHHRAASCPDPPATCDQRNLNTDNPSPHILYGGLVGGPILNDGYNDTRPDYVHNEVALDYNSGFQSALAGRWRCNTLL